MQTPVQVAVLGFSSFERRALSAHLKLGELRTPQYSVVLEIEQARFVIADADQPGVTELLQQLGRTADAVFVGAAGPLAAAAWMMRPIDPAHILRELDRMLDDRAYPSSSPMPLGLPSGHGTLRPVPVPIAGRSPTRRASDPDLQAAVPARRPRAAVPAAVPIQRALLVDDSDLALHFLQRQLHPYGLQCDLAYDSTEALERLAVFPYALVLLDVDLGEGSEMGGLALCKHIKQRQVHMEGRAPTVIMVSAFHDAVHRVRGTLAGADAYLGKPLDSAALGRLLAGLGMARKPSVA